VLSLPLDPGHVLNRASVRRTVARGFWCGLIAVHLPAAALASGRLLDLPVEELGGAAVRLMGLLATLAFFVFKAAGGRVLPERTRRWFAIAAFAALTGVGHAALLPADAAGPLIDPASSALVIGTAVAVVTHRRRIVRRLTGLIDTFERLSRWVIEALGLAHSRRPRFALSLAAFGGGRWRGADGALRALVPRGPPVIALGC
jgi:hypothetical protein